MSLPTSVNNPAVQLPFYCSSTSLTFYLDDPSSFSQVLTVYNPYSFVVRYKILCTASQKYSIAEPQGEIRDRHSVDTIVRLLDTSSSSINQNVIHKLRIQFFDRRKPQELIGKCDVICNILSYKSAEANLDETTNTISRFNRTTINPVPAVASSETRDPLVIFILSVIGIVCGLILVAPTIPDPESDSSNTRIPAYLHMTTNAKVIASYILGLLTVVFIRR